MGKLKTEDAAGEKLPLISNVPLCACTVPLLLNATAKKVVVPVPADLRKVPALLNAEIAPTQSPKRAVPLHVKDRTRLVVQPPAAIKIPAVPPQAN